jgi:hypothetical protein
MPIMAPMLKVDKTYSAKITRVNNKDKHFNAASDYLHIRVAGKSYLVTTNAVIGVGGKRAREQPEDCRQQGFFARFFSFLK